jgi:hypothetical protein
MPNPHTVTAVISDTHIGSHTAIALHEWVLDDGQTIQANLAQDWLYASWLDYWSYVTTLCGIQGRHRKNRLVVIHLGDIIEGKNHGSVQLMANTEDQMAMACELLRPLAAMADGGFYCTRGTEAHAGDAAQAEVRICKEIGARACEWELLLDIDEVLFDCGHYGRAGRRDWTSSAAGVASEVAISAALAGELIPDYILRGHNHLIDDSGSKLPGIRAIMAPAWQLRTAFGYRIAPNRRSDIGGMIFDGYNFDGSKLRYHAAPGQKRIISI